MRVIHKNVTGLEVHKKVVMAAIIVQQAVGTWLETKRTFDTMTSDLLDFSDWLMVQGVTHVAMESKGEF